MTDPHNTWNDVGEGLVGAAGMALAFLTPMFRGLRAHWGIPKELAERAYPVDDLIEKPRWGWTHGIEIEASVEEVWPWVAQIGQDKAGFYSYQWLENLVGCDIENVEDLHPEWQGLRLGEGLKMHPDMAPAPIVLIEPERCFAIYSHLDLETGEGIDHKPIVPYAHFLAVSWLFFLEPTSTTTCRFISRFRTDYSDDLDSRFRYGPLVTEPVGFVMDRKMLMGIKGLAEASAALRR